MGIGVWDCWLVEVLVYVCGCEIRWLVGYVDVGVGGLWNPLRKSGGAAFGSRTQFTRTRPACIGRRRTVESV